MVGLFLSDGRFGQAFGQSGGMAIPVIDELDLSEKTVLLRVDFNVPQKDGVITDDARIQAQFQRFNTLIGAQCHVVICGHLGRPKGQSIAGLSLEPAAARLAELLDHETHFHAQYGG